MFVNTEIRGKMETKEYQKDINDLIHISEIQLTKLIREVREKYSKGFSKEYREMAENKVVSEVVKYMKEYDMIRENKSLKEYIIMPICFKIIGKYPKDFEKI